MFEKGGRGSVSVFGPIFGVSLCIYVLIFVGGCAKVFYWPAGPGEPKE